MFSYFEATFWPFVYVTIRKEGALGSSGMKIYRLTVLLMLTDSEAPEEVFWAAEQPRSNGLKCAVLKLTNNNEYEWVATHCEETSNVICQNCM